MDNLPGNSKTTQGKKVRRETVVRTEPPTAAVPAGKPKQEQIVSGVRTRKKPLGRRFMETFFGGSDARSVWSYVVHDVLVPAAKDMVADAGQQAIERTLFGEVRRSSRRSSVRTNNAGHVDYRGMSGSTIRRAPREEERHILRPTSGRHNLDDIVFDTRAEAYAVLERMRDVIDQYEVVSENDLLDMVGLTGDYVRENWGWDNLVDASVARARGGDYVLNLPRSEPLK